MVTQLEGAEQPISHVDVSWKSQRKWSPPPEGWAKLNVDGSFSHEDGSAGAGMILSGHAGAIIFSA